jgi:outer membrane cobalamin receptor
MFLCCVLIVLPLPMRAQQTPPATNPPSPPKAADLAPVTTSVTVNARISTETPGSITTLDATQLSETPGVDLDDVLHSVAGFSLYRRTSSVVANPTTQGVSLRGLGSTGASRTLVLWDGVPMNDPFGGWVYWTRFPIDEIQEVEIVRGAATSVFGDRAMSGAISILSRPPERHRLDASYEAGNEDTQQVTLGGSNLWRDFAVSADTRAFRTDGYYIVPASIRGAADTRANVHFVTGDARLDWFRGAQRLSIRLDILAEERANGTMLTHNSTSLGTLSGTYSWQQAHDGISLMGFHTREDFHASFSSVSADRDSEHITYLQTVPSQATGGSLFWAHSGSHWNTLTGADVEHDEGTSTDHLMPSGLRVGGGSRVQRGVFAQFNALAGPIRLFVGAREHFTGAGQTFFSPSAGIAAGRGILRFRGSVYRSFRAPTLNELYREFRVGNIDTLPNPALQPETLVGGEAGFDLTGESRRLSVTAFHNSLDHLITNVTLAINGSSITRERENAAAAVAEGVEAEFHQTWRSWRADVTYAYAHSQYVTGSRIAQVPRNQGSGQIAYLRGRFLASAGLRAYSSQFDDDLNQFLLPGYATVEFAARERLTASLSADLTFDNLLDHQYLVALTPTPNTGEPRLWRVGLRWDGHWR